MLTNVRTFFVCLLRGTVIATAMISFLIASGTALCNVRTVRSESQVRIVEQVERFRQAVDPVKLIKQVFPADAPIVKKKPAPTTSPTKGASGWIPRYFSSSTSSSTAG